MEEVLSGVWEIWRNFDGEFLFSQVSFCSHLSVCIVSKFGYKGITGYARHSICIYPGQLGEMLPRAAASPRGSTDFLLFVLSFVFVHVCLVLLRGKGQVPSVRFSVSLIILRTSNREQPNMVFRLVLENSGHFVNWNGQHLA